MRVITNKNKTVFVMSTSGSNCPRMIVPKGSAKMRDDYHGSIRTRSKLVAKFMSL